MEGKAVLFKKFADLDAFDLEVKGGKGEGAWYFTLACPYLNLPYLSTESPCFYLA
jgi:hypothetical protein